MNIVNAVLNLRLYLLWFTILCIYIYNSKNNNLFIESIYNN